MLYAPLGAENCMDTQTAVEVPALACLIPLLTSRRFETTATWNPAIGRGAEPLRNGQ
jgi:hypothetical protein